MCLIIHSIFIFYILQNFFCCTVYTFTDKHLDYSNFPQKVRKQFAVYGVLGTGTFGEVRLAFEKVSLKYKYFGCKLKIFFFLIYIYICIRIILLYYIV